MASRHAISRCRIMPASRRRRNRRAPRARRPELLQLCQAANVFHERPLLVQLELVHFEIVVKVDVGVVCPLILVENRHFVFHGLSHKVIRAPKEWALSVMDRGRSR